VELTIDVRGVDPQSKAGELVRILNRLNAHYGRGDLVQVEVKGGADISNCWGYFTRQPFCMSREQRLFTVKNGTVKALGRRARASFTECTSKGDR
jgi:hypothetical protein